MGWGQKAGGRGEGCFFFIIIFLIGIGFGVQVVNYVLTRPGREILFTVITREEKYKAKVGLTHSALSLMSCCGFIEGRGAVVGWDGMGWDAGYD